MTPGGVLCELSDVFRGGDIRAGEGLIDLDELTLEGVTGEVDALGEGSEVLLEVTDTSIKVVVENFRHVKRVCRAELDASCVVAWVSFEDCPGEPVVVGGSVVTVSREVTTEVDGATEDEDVKIVLLGDAGLVEHGGTQSRGFVDTTVAQDRVVPARKALVLVTAVEPTAIECDEIRGSFALDADLIVVLEVSANTGKVDNDRNVKILELAGGTDTAEFQELRRVVCASGDDDFARSSRRSSLTSIAAVLGAGLVKVLTVKELNTSSTRGSGLVEVDLGNVAVGPDIWAPY